MLWIVAKTSGINSSKWKLISLWFSFLLFAVTLLYLVLGKIEGGRKMLRMTFFLRGFLSLCICLSIGEINRPKENG